MKKPITFIVLIIMFGCKPKHNESKIEPDYYDSIRIFRENQQKIYYKKYYDSLKNSVKQEDGNNNIIK